MLPWERRGFGSYSSVLQLLHSTAKQGRHQKQRGLQKEDKTLQAPAESCTSLLPQRSLSTKPEESLASLAQTCSRTGDSPATTILRQDRGGNGGGEHSKKEKHSSSRRLSSGPSRQDTATPEMSIMQPTVILLARFSASTQSCRSF